MTDTCWLCCGLGGIAVHKKASAYVDRTVWVAHRPESNSHPVEPCPVCQTAVSPIPDGPQDGIIGPQPQTDRDVQ